MNARDIITAALRKIRVKRAGFDPSAEEMADGLEELNNMIDSWSADDLLVPYRTRESFTLTQGQQPHTIGSGGDLDTTQPTDIHEAILVSSTTRYPLHIGNLDDLGSVADLTTQGRPHWIYFERGLTTGNIWFEYAPDEAYTLILHTLKRLTTFATLDTDESFPDEYRQALVYNLAVNLAPDAGKEPSRVVVVRAEQTLKTIERNVSADRVPLLEYDAAIARTRPRYDIDTGYG